MKLKDTYNDILFEAGGLSSESRAWSSILIQIGGTTKINPFIINGKDYPEVYENFPVDTFIIETRNGPPEYDEQRSGYEEGKYVVYLNFPNTQFETTEPMISMLNHELRHAYEDYKRISTNRTPLSQTKELQQFYNKDFEKVVTGGLWGNYKPFTTILMAFYYTSNVERSALADSFVDGTEIPIMDTLESIMDGSYIKSEDLSDDKLAQKRWDSLKKQVDIPILNNFDDYMKFIGWANKILKKRATKTYKKLHKTKYLSQQDNENKKGDETTPL